MSVGIVHYFSGGEQAQYEAELANVHPADGGLPEGQTYHVAGPTGDGWIIVAVFESSEHCHRFLEESAGIVAGGFTAEPEETNFTVFKEQTA